MGLIPRADIDRMARDAVVLDLADVERRGALLREAAEQEAARIIAEAKAQRAKILAGAAEQARIKGMEEGREQGRVEGAKQARAEVTKRYSERLETIASGWETLLDTVESERGRMMSDARRDVLRLALRVAELVTKRVVELDPGVAESNLAEALALVLGKTRLMVAVSPQDEDVLRQAMPKLVRRFESAREAEIVADDSVPRGGCVVRSTEGAEIDATVETQLRRIVRELMPGAEIVEDEAPSDDDASNESGADA